MTPDLLFLNIFLTGFLTRSLSRQLCLRAAAGWPSSACGCDRITVPLGLFGLSMPHSFLSWDRSSLRNSSILRVPWISPSVACPCSSGYLQAPTESPVSCMQSGILYTWATCVPVHGNGTILQHAEQMLPQPRRGLRCTRSLPYLWSPLTQRLAPCYGISHILSYRTAYLESPC